MGKNFNDVPKEIRDAIFTISEMKGINPITLRRLFILTSEKRCSEFIRLKGYNSNASMNTEVADHTIQINVVYQKMLDKDALTLAHPDEIIKDEFLKVEQKWNYEKYDLVGVPIEIFRAQVKANFGVALKEKRESKTEPKERVSNDIRLNKVLVFNTNKMNFGLTGISVTKTIKKEGVFKKVKSVPLTVAKQIIDKCTESKSAKYRRFIFDNLNGLKIQGETLELGGGK